MGRAWNLSVFCHALDEAAFDAADKRVPKRVNLGVSQLALSALVVLASPYARADTEKTYALQIASHKMAAPMKDTSIRRPKTR